jgi:hypothetical protein
MVIGLPPAAGVAVTTMFAGNPSVLLPVTVRLAGETLDDDCTSLESVALMAVSTV